MEKNIYKSTEGRDVIMATYDSFIKVWPVPYKTIFIPTRYGNTFVISSGNDTSPPLLLIHGASSNSASWGGEIKAYSKHFHVFAVDVIGEPGKSSQTRPPWEGDAYSEWLDDVVVGLNLKKISLLGISQGGWIVLNYAISRKDKVDKLVLLSPAGVVATRTSFILKAIFYTFLGKWGAFKLNQYVFGNQKIDTTTLRVMNEIITHTVPRIDKEYIFKDSELQNLKNILTLLICGKQDVIRTADKIKIRLAENLDHLSTIVLPDKGHVLINVADKIIPFLLRE